MDGLRIFRHCSPLLVAARSLGRMRIRVYDWRLPAVSLAVLLVSATNLEAQRASDATVGATHLLEARRPERPVAYVPDDSSGHVCGRACSVVVGALIGGGISAVWVGKQLAHAEEDVGGAGVQVGAIFIAGGLLVGGLTGALISALR